MGAGGTMRAHVRRKSGPGVRPALANGITARLGLAPGERYATTRSPSSTALHGKLPLAPMAFFKRTLLAERLNGVGKRG